MGKVISASVEYRVPYADTDQMGFVYYGNYLTYFERSRNQLLKSTGFSYKELEALGLGLPVIEARVFYHRPAKYDDLLRIEAESEWDGGLRMMVKCRVLRDDELLADGYTLHVFMDLASGRPLRPRRDVMEKWYGTDLEAGSDLNITI